MHPTTSKPLTEPTPLFLSRVMPVISLCLALLTLLVASLSYFTRQRAPSTNSDLELKTLQQEVRQKQESLQLLKNRPLTSPITAESLASRIKVDTERFLNFTLALQERLEKQNALLSKNETALKNAHLVQSSLLTDLESAKNKLQAIPQLTLSTKTLHQQLNESQAQLSKVTKELAQAQKRLNQASKNIQLKQMQEHLKEKEQEITRLKTNSNLGTLSHLQAENAQLRNALEHQKTKFYKTQVFAENTNELSLTAQKLYQKLSSVESLTIPERLKTYEVIKKEWLATVIDTVSFPIGSSTIEKEKVNLIKQKVTTAPLETEFLIVGYASQSGDAITNKILSSERATAVATIIATELNSTQRTRAVYLGQTSRFSKKNDYLNQTCEIWTLKKKNRSKE